MISLDETAFLQNVDELSNHKLGMRDLGGRYPDQCERRKPTASFLVFQVIFGDFVSTALFDKAENCMHVP